MKLNLELKKFFYKEDGVIPPIILIALAVGLILGGIAGFTAYFMTHTFTWVILGICLIVLFFVVLVPSLPSIVAYCRTFWTRVRDKERQFNKK
jgi:membrane protein YdbS with pleckstrin-like domain